MKSNLVKEKVSMRPYTDEIITICGSRKFEKQIDVFRVMSERHHKIVFTPNWSFRVDEFNRGEVDINKLHETFDRKILMSDRLYVMNWDNYVGEDTQREIDFAIANSIPVLYICENVTWVNIIKKDMEFNKRNFMQTISNTDLILEVERRVANNKLTIDVNIQEA